MKKTNLLVLILAMNLTTRVAKADFTFGEPVNLTSTIPVIDPMHGSIDCFSYDGLEMFIESDRSGGFGDYDMWVLRRDSIEEDWGPPENLGPTVNSSEIEAGSSISVDGLTLYFSSWRPDVFGDADIYVTRRTTENEPWGPPENLGPTVNSSEAEFGLFISVDGLTLYFSSWRPGGYGDADIYVARRTTENEPWGTSENLGPIVNTTYAEADPWISPDGLLLLFSGTFWGAGPGRRSWRF
jgi:hypothetical protein